jgi:predicted SnoaL-like aldol condensation-catalyzing enzyme
LQQQGAEKCVFLVFCAENPDSAGHLISIEQAQRATVIHGTNLAANISPTDCEADMTVSGSERRQRSATTRDSSTSRKEIAIAFIQKCASGSASEAFAEYASPHFFHHNPFFTGDAAALMAGMEENAKQNPKKTLEVKHALEENELVVLHARVRHRPGELGVALVHIFRFKDNRIIEMWDIGQPVPPNSPNEYGMF